MVNSGAVIEVRDKASGEIFAEAISATLADVDEAAAAAKRAQPAWAELPYTERTAVLRAAAAALTDRAKQFRELIIRETGSIGGKADYEIGAATSELIEAAGLPAGLFGVLPGDVEVGHRLVTHPDITMIHFTGSTKVGRQIAQTAGGLLRKVSLELGSNNALIVLDDADLDQAAMIGAWSSFHYQGQTCITAGRHIVQAQIADEYARRLAARAEVISVGNTFTEDVGLGPMINHTQLTRAVELLAEAVKDGATVLAGGTTDGPFFRPTVVTNVSPSSPALDRGDLRPDRPHPGGAGRRGGGRRGQRHRLPAGQLGADRGSVPGYQGGAAIAGRHGARQRRDPAGRGDRSLRRDRPVRTGRPIR